MTSVTPARAVGVQGDWSEKNVRVRRRFAPLKGRENENQNSASAVWSVDWALNSPRS
jgi:hypothetical protein